MMLTPAISGFSGWATGHCSRVAALIISPTRTRSRPSSGVIANPSGRASAIAYHMPPYATSTVTVPISGTSTGTSRCAAKAGTLRNVTPVTLPSATSARTPMRPAGVSSVSSVTGSTAGRIPVSSSTVTVQIVLLPDIGGYSACSMITKPASASGWVGGRTRLQHSAG
jgi:hypothetical protein